MRRTDDRDGCAGRKNRARVTLHHAAAALALAFILGGCSSGDDEAIIQRTLGDTQPDQTLIAPRIVITEHGLTTGIVTADSLAVVESRDLTTLDGHVELRFYNSEEVHTTTLTALHGRLWGLYDQVDSLRASGNVVVVSQERGERLETDELRWIFADHTVYADGFVKITTKDGYEQGWGLVAKDDLGSYTLREVSGEVSGHDISLPER